MLLHPKGKYEIAIEAELVSVRYGIFGGWRLSGRGRPLAVACHQARKEHSIKPNQLGGGGAKTLSLAFHKKSISARENMSTVKNFS